MAIVRPASGTLIARANVTDMHAEARSIVNALPLAYVRRGALGPQHVAGVLLDADFEDITTTTLVNAVMTEETQLDVVTNWQPLTGFRLDNGGPGYVFAQDANIVAWTTVRVEKFYVAGAEARPQERQQCWVALCYRFGGADYCDLVDIGMTHGQRDGAIATAYTEGEELLTIYTVLESSAFTLQNLHVRAAVGVGGPVAGAVSDYKVTNGSIGFFAVRPA